MDNTLIDDRRIHVDFSQSVAKLWGQFRHGTRNNTNKGESLPLNFIRQLTFRNFLFWLWLQTLPLFYSFLCSLIPHNTNRSIIFFFSLMSLQVAVSSVVLLITLPGSVAIALITSNKVQNMFLKMTHSVVVVVIIRGLLLSNSHLTKRRIHVLISLAICRRYEMLFDEDDLQGQEKSKKRKVDHRDAERSKQRDNERISTRGPDDDDERRGGRDRSDRHGRDDDPKQTGRERVDRPRRDDDHPRRRTERDYERNRGTERADAHNRDKGARERYEVREQHKRHESNRHKGNVDHRSSSSSRHAKEGSDSDKHRKYEGDQGRRNTDSNLQSRDDEFHRERRHRDDKRK